ncbi:MAG: flippase-like domain-containing protein [Anaerolineales bacterium]|nr:flippase-like domain-containing protein [Anaerolineales bacterium]
MQTPQPKSSRLWTFAKVILAVLLIGIVFSQTSWEDLLALRSRIVWGWTALYVILYFLLTAFKAYQYKKLLDLPIPYPRVVSVVVLQNGLSNIVANSAGIVSYLVMLRGEQGVKVSRAALVFVITKIGDLFAVWLALLLSSFFIWQKIPSLHSLTIVLLVLIGLGLFTFLLVVVLRGRFVDIIKSILIRTKLTHISIVERSVDSLQALVEQERGSLYQMTLTAFSLSFIYFLMTFFWSYTQIKMFSVSLDLFPFLFITAILQLVSIIPITILGGLGVTEASSMMLYPLFGIDPVSFAAVLIGMRLIFYLINLVVLLYLPLYGFVENRKNKM